MSDLHDDAAGSVHRHRTILVTGADGMLGRAFQDAAAELSNPPALLALSHADLDVTDLDAVMALGSTSIDLIVHCAGMTRADACERDPDRARTVHVEGTRHIARLAAETGAQVIYPQSVFIFDGRELPVTEQTRPAPRLTYGRVKLEAEMHLRDALPDSLIVRMAGFFGGEARDKNFVGLFTRQLARDLAVGRKACDVGDRVWQPTYTLDLARNTFELIAHHKYGVYHMGAQGEATFFEVATACVELLGLTNRMAVRSVPAERFTAVEPADRPHRMVTATERLDQEGLNRQRPWRDALAEYLARPYFDPLRRAADDSRR